MATKWYNKAMKRSQKGILKKTNKYNSIAPNHLSYLPIYRVWGAMIRRCSEPKCDMYYCYGKRGVKVCERWSNPDTGFINFYNDMGPRPKDSNGRSYQIDRINGDGDYCPENCRWVSARENQLNKKRTKKIYLFGEMMSVRSACLSLHLNPTTVIEAIRLRKMSVEDAFLNALKHKYGDRLCVL